MADDHESTRLTQLFEKVLENLVGTSTEKNSTSLADLIEASTGILVGRNEESSPTNSPSSGSSADGAQNRASLGLAALSSLLPSSPLPVVSAASRTSATDDGGLSGVWKFLAGGFGVAPALTAITRLFGGGDVEPLPELVPYEAPPKLRLDASGRTTSPDHVELSGVTYDERGLPRQASSAIREQNITVQIQALDSRSFLDHSHDIARAVREAMLHMDPINDVVNDI